MQQQFQKMQAEHFLEITSNGFSSGGPKQRTQETNQTASQWSVSQQTMQAGADKRQSL